jgi:hypothetical protein
LNARADRAEVVLSHTASGVALTKDSKLLADVRVYADEERC